MPQYGVNNMPVKSANKQETAQELIVFTNNGQTFHFKDIKEFRPTTTGFEFTYFGMATHKTRKAVFNNTSVAGFAVADM